MMEQDNVQMEQMEMPASPGARKRSRSRKKRSSAAGALVLPAPLEDLTAEELLARLKSERVQEALAAMPEWQQLPDGLSLQRVRQFPQAAAAKAYVVYALETATAFKLPISLQWADRQLVITLRGFTQKSRQSGITMTMVHLAAALG